MKKNIYFENLGCPKNIVDSSVTAGHLIDNGYSITYTPEDADIIIINTCSFIRPAVNESIETIKYYIKNKGRKKIILAGCLIEREKEKIQRIFPEADGIIGTGELNNIISIIKKEKMKGCHKKGDVSFCSRPNLFTPSHYTYIKIGEGCNHRCSFCIIPQLKGRYKSKPMEIILREVSLLPNEVKEINLIAQDTTYFGMDIYGKPALDELLMRLNKVFNGWIRILYGHPLHTNLKLLDTIVHLENVIPYIDVPIQHISDKILKKMRRGYGKRDVIKIVEGAKKRGIAIRTTFITGFPGEGEREFQELISFITQYELNRVAVFPYFSEKGAGAYKLHTIPENERWKRVETLQEIISEINFRKNRKMVGKKVKVLVDGEEDGKYFGRTVSDAPDIDQIVRLKGKVREGNFVNAKIYSAEDFSLSAVPTSSPMGSGIDN